jgi:hypothetical protein
MVNSAASVTAGKVFLELTVGDGAGGVQTVTLPNAGTLWEVGTTTATFAWEQILMAQLQAAWSMTAGRNLGVYTDGDEYEGNGSF